jgi:hypothetical protein
MGGIKLYKFRYKPEVDGPAVGSVWRRPGRVLRWRHGPGGASGSAGLRVHRHRWDSARRLCALGGAVHAVGRLGEAPRAQQQIGGGDGR